MIERPFAMHYGISSSVYNNVADSIILIYSKKMEQDDYRYLVNEELEDIDESMGTKA